MLDKSCIPANIFIHICIPQTQAYSHKKTIYLYKSQNTYLQMHKLMCTCIHRTNRHAKTYWHIHLDYSTISQESPR